MGGVGEGVAGELAEGRVAGFVEGGESGRVAGICCAILDGLRIVSIEWLGWE